MELGQALSQISEIHGHLAKSEVYRGYRPQPLVATGLFALAAAALEPRFVRNPIGLDLVRFWLTAGVICAAICGFEALRNYIREGGLSRRKMLRVLGQFSPCLLAGGALTAAISLRWPGAIPLLPGLWAVLFSLGLFAMRPYLPHSIGWVALFYLCGGFALLTVIDTSVPAWGMGIVFGAGQLATAWVFHRNLERQYD